MLKKIRLGAKVAFGFAAVTVLAVIVGGSAYVLIGKLNKEATFADKANAIKQACLEARRQEKNYIIRKGEEDFKLWQKAVDEIRTGITDALRVAGDQETGNHLADSAKVVDRYKGLADNLREVTLIAAKLDDEMRKAARAVEAHLKKMKDSAPAIMGLLNARRQEKNVILYQDAPLHQGEKTYLEKWKDAMAGVEKWSETDSGLKRLNDEYTKLISARVTSISQSKVIDANMIDCARSLLKASDQMLEKARKSMEDLQNAARNLILSILGICIAVAAALAYFLTTGITKPIQWIIEGLNEGAEQVASASGQVSSASQSLAEGASEQAASVEETSSSLEEISSMTKQNAENAGQADNLMKSANLIVNKANESMAELTTSMQEISNASVETSKIIKTIDEIAFQTNLLALNAAVEAARAGEAGAGFAVVADEVRNLSMRAADAAKNTANLIEGTVKKVRDGSELVTRTNEAFSEVAESATKVGGLVAEIATASNEQAQGIDQVNQAVAEMDKVVQQNAASAEESASASEEMNAQAEQMKEMVNELVTLVEGHAGRAERKAGMRKAVEAPAKGPKGRDLVPHRATLQLYRGIEVSPEEVIPMNDADFKNF